jgi:hypothetical protein
MGTASYNRGSKLVQRAADTQAHAAGPRADREAFKEQLARLLERNAKLERELSRARRCVAELRRSKDAARAETRADQASSRFAISILARLAFPEDRKEVARLDRPSQNDPFADPSYRAHVEACSKYCQCCASCSDHPCAGSMAGGICDQARCHCDDEREDSEDSDQSEDQ